MDLFAIDGAELTRRLESHTRASAVYARLRRGCDPFTDAETPPGARRRLAGACRPAALSVRAIHQSQDGTTKVLFGLEDDRAIETVLIPNDRHEGRTTLCISSQVGCARGCSFCLTASMKLVRNLSQSEIVAQVATALRLVREQKLPALRNVVFMGMGEPLDNLDAVSGALELIVGSPLGLGIGKNHITLSTVGPSPDLIRATRDLPANLAWSLHAADDDLRKQLIPTHRHPVAELCDAFREVLAGRPLFVEITLIADTNDGDEHADRIIALFEHFDSEVRFNLLPMNPIPGSALRPSAVDRVRAFERRLRKAGHFAMVRRARGENDRAACGQLAVTIQRGRSVAAKGSEIAP